MHLVAPGERGLFYRERVGMVVLMSEVMRCSQHFCLHIARHVCICLLCGGSVIGATTYSCMLQVSCTKPVLASSTVERLWRASHESTAHEECMLHVWWYMLNPVKLVQCAG